MEQVTTLIENLGFPIVLSIYLLIRFEKKIDLLNQSITALNNTIIELLKEKVENKNGMVL